MIHCIWTYLPPRKKATVTEKLTESGVWVVPKGVYKISLCLVGGGGAGGTSSHGGGGGGAGGEVVMANMTVVPNQSIPYTIGIGGTNGKETGTYVYSKSTNGGDTLFGEYVAKGGLCGIAASGSYAIKGGDGGALYTKGGNGASRTSLNGAIATQATNGVNGVLIDGEYYGSSAGGAGVSNTNPSSASGMSGMNAGVSFRLYDSPDSSQIAKPNTGSGGGASFTSASSPAVKTGADGVIIINY